MKKPVRKPRARIENLPETTKDLMAEKVISDDKLRFTRGGVDVDNQTPCSCTNCGDTDCD
jgi:hypothetical protein